MADDPKLKILIETSADPKGAEEAKRSIQEVSQTAEQAAPRLEGIAAAGEKASGTFAQMRQAGGPATQILRGLEQAGRGGIGALFGLAQAIRGVIAAVTAGLGPIGLLVAAAGLLGGVFLALKDKFRPAKESIDDVAKKTEAARLELVKLNQEQVDNVVANYKRIEDAADAARQAAAAVRAQQEARFDANEEIAVAKLRERPDLSRAQRLQEEQGIRSRAQAARDQNAFNADLDAISDAGGAFETAAGVEAAKTKARASAESQLQELQRIEGRKKEIDQAQSELAAARKSMQEGALLGAQGRIPSGELDRRRDVLQAAERRAGELPDELPAAEQAILKNAESIKRTFETLDAELKKAADATTAASRNLEAANNQFVTNLTRRSEKARTAQEVGAIDARIAAREEDPAAVAAAKIAADRKALEQQTTDAFNQVVATKKRQGADEVTSLERKIRDTAVFSNEGAGAATAARQALLKERDALIAAQDADLKAIRQRYEAALAAIRATPLPEIPAAPQNTIIRGSKLPTDQGFGEQPSDDDAALGINPSPAAAPGITPPGGGGLPGAMGPFGVPSPFQRGGGGLPGGSKEVDIEPLQESFDEGASAVQELEVPPIDPAPMAKAVRDANVRIQKRVDDLSKEVSSTIGQIDVTLASHQHELKILRGMIEARAM